MRHPRDLSPGRLQGELGLRDGCEGEICLPMPVITPSRSYSIMRAGEMGLVPAGNKTCGVPSQTTTIRHPTAFPPNRYRHPWQPSRNLPCSLVSRFAPFLGHSRISIYPSGRPRQSESKSKSHGTSIPRKSYRRRENFTLHSPRRLVHHERPDPPRLPSQMEQKGGG
jgi:hypothetical protein